MPPQVVENLLARVRLAAEAVRLAELGREREQRWGRVRLLAERKYGELLGPAEKGNPEFRNVTASHIDDDERKRRERARDVADVPEETFTEYVDTAEKPTRAAPVDGAARAGGAHLALGYSSWGDYFEAEFGQSERQGYRLLDAARVRELLPATDQLVTESQARELAPLLADEREVVEAWREAKAEAE